MYLKKIKSVTVDGTEYAATGKRAVKIIKEDGTIDTTAAPFKNAENGQEFKITVKATGYAKDCEFTYTVAQESEYTYAYVGLSWAEYWAAENVQAAGDTSSSDAKDSKGESDKGAFDTVTRATVNHGLHRGSFQCNAVIKAENGKEYAVEYWTDGTTAVLTDGSKITFNRGEITEESGATTKMTEYDVLGLKYVPVKVKTSDLDALKASYRVIENGSELAGGYSEKNLVSYTGLVANVTENTNGLKTATKNENGSFSFSARVNNGSESGIKDQALKTAPTAEEVGLKVKEASGSYGEFLRVDLTGKYGDLGSNLQTVTWTYYGDDSTYTNAKATYGTKFAADNWMHKAMGIQLGLTDSLRCKLPEGTDGTGYWTITLTALGYNDVTYKFQATEENIVKASEGEKITTTELEAAIAKAEALTESDYTAESWASMQMELQEAKDELKTTSMPCALQIRPWKPSKENSAVLPENPLLQFEVYAADRDGAFCFGDSSMVQVTTDGGVLLGIENGNAADCTEYASSCRRLYHGRLIFYVRRSFADHPVTVQVSSELLKSNSVTIF